jgi:hypothetical protein
MADKEPDRDPADGGDDDAGQRRPKTTLSPQEALDKLRLGLTLENVRIERLVFKGPWEKPFKLKNCHLVKPRFDGATFQGDIEMVSCTVERPHFSGKVEFKGNWRMNSATLVGWQMSRITVQGKWDLTGATVKGTMTVAGCTFTGGIRLWEAHFHNWVNFKKCEFGGDIDMRSFVAQQGFVAAACKFNADVALRGASVGMKCDLSGSRFEGLLDFSRAKMNDYWYLEEIEMGEKCLLSFSNAVGSRLLIKPSQIEGRLQSEHDRDYLRAMKEYAFLKSCYGEQHRYEDEDWAFHRFKVMQRRGVDRSWYRPWTKVTQFLDWLFLDLGCGYCTNPYRAIRTAGIVILVFAVIFALGIESFNNLETEKLPIPQPKPAAGQDWDAGDVTWPNRVIVGLLTSVSLFTSGANGITNMARGWMNLPIMLEAMIGLLLWGLFIVSFSRKVIR